MKKPNIVYLLNDHQAFYGHGLGTSPEIARPRFCGLAAEGVEFLHSYTACPLCGPARRTMLTGQYPHQHGEIINDIDVPFSGPTYLERLKDAGYRNFYFGKWHAGPGTALQHACEGFSYPSYNNPYIQPEYRAYLERSGLTMPEIYIEHNFVAWRDDVHEHTMYTQDKPWCNEHASGIMQGPKEAHESFFLASLAREQLRSLAQEKNDQPFSLRVDFWGPHQPYFPTADFAALYDSADIKPYPSFYEDVYTSGKPEIYQSEQNLGISRNGKLISPNPLPWSVWQEVMARAYAQITQVDAAAGVVLDALREFGFAENTMVIMTTDHGDALACHGGHFDKRSYMPEEMIRVPLAVRYPGVIPPGQRSNELVSNIDVAPTILDAAGTSFETPVAGKSLLPVMKREQKNLRPYVVTETHGHMEKHIGRAVCTGRYKYVYNRGQLDELYDLSLDPYEMKNRIGDKELAPVEAELKADLRDWVEQTGDEVIRGEI